ncbi:hypothetical protein RhiirA4_482352 [Rhizophagus irregularis]|uniref:Uncharacterized protein n=1 Tax=Rhizophagus irregularis TaxID=588596 RepID=A0A2I1HKZ4_9GLOM|nr:hypothetical protein RhiirA4_482352 [Rhizophagus irregularis]
MRYRDISNQVDLTSEINFSFTRSPISKVPAFPVAPFEGSRLSGRQFRRFPPFRSLISISKVPGFEYWTKLLRTKSVLRLGGSWTEFRGPGHHFEGPGHHFEDSGVLKVSYLNDPGLLKVLSGSRFGIGTPEIMKT